MSADIATDRYVLLTADGLRVEINKPWAGKTMVRPLVEKSGWYSDRRYDLSRGEFDKASGKQVVIFREVLREPPGDLEEARKEANYYRGRAAELEGAVRRLEEENGALALKLVRA